MKSYFIFGGAPSLNYGISVESYPDISFPERVLESYSVPGRNGNLIFDTGAYGNTTQIYSCWYKPLPGISSYDQIRELSKWLLSSAGYQRLEDTYTPDVYRMALYAGPADISTFFKKYGRIEIEFNCMPQRWLKAGEVPIDITSGMQLHNDGEPALPLIQVSGSGSGTVSIGNRTVSLSSIPAAGVIIDSDTQNIYSETQNYNSIASVTGGGFPILLPGLNNIQYSGGVTAVQITPRWWVL